MTFPLDALVLCFGHDDHGDSQERAYKRAYKRAMRETTSETTALPVSAGDAMVVNQIRSGDPQAFEQLFLEHAKGLVTFAMGYVRSREVAEDVVADAFAVVWERHAEWTPRQGIRAYLYAAVRNRALNATRNEGARRRLIEHAAPPPVHPRAADDALVIEEQLAIVRRTIGAFPEHRRRIMELRWRDGLSAAEIAIVLGTTRNAVDVQLTRALQVLRTVLPGSLE